jgi:hypothetical protein
LLYIFIKLEERAGPAEPVHVPGGPDGEERAPLLQAPLRERGGAHAHRLHPHRRPRLPEVRPGLQAASGDYFLETGNSILTSDNFPVATV